MKKILMLGTSNGTCHMLKKAKEMGFYTIVTDYLPYEQSIGKQKADEYWMINTTDTDALEKKCREVGVDAVFAGVSGFNLRMGKILCERLGLPHYINWEAYHYATDKADFKAKCKEIGVPIPTDYDVSDALTDEEIAKVEFPVMVKPVDQSSNRGISYCYNASDLKQGFKLARSFSKNPKIVVERMLHGEEWFSSYAVVDGKATLLAMNAMYAQPGEPKFCYTITSTVSRHVERFVKEINPKIEELLSAVGCKDGFAWVQFMLDEDDDKFYVIEMGYRLDGALVYIPYEKVCGFDTVKFLLQYASGLKGEDLEKPIQQKQLYKKCGCAMMLWTNKSGTVKEIHGIKELWNNPAIMDVDDHNLQIGAAIGKYRPMAVITFVTESCDEMCQVIDKINKEVRIINENGEDVVIKYTDFDYLKKIYSDGLAGK